MQSTARPRSMHQPHDHADRSSSTARPTRTARRPAHRLLQVVLTLRPGGAEYLVAEMCRRLSPEFEMTVCCLDDEGPWAPMLRQDGVDVVALYREPGFRPQLGRVIADLAARRRASLLHCHLYSPFVYGRIAKLWSPGLKLVYTDHGRNSDDPPSWKRRLVNPLLARFDGPIVAVSHELRQYLIASNFPPDRVRVIHNGIVTGPPPSAAERHQMRRMLGLDDDAFIVMTIARLDPVKDFGVLIEAFARARRRVPRACLIIVGDGPERSRLTAMAADADLGTSVIFLGYRHDSRRLLAAADLFVNSSITEGVSLTILEAMASGVPVVATNVGGTPEVIDQTSGVLVQSRHPKELSAAIAGLAADAPRRIALAAAARQRVEARFTMERMINDYARLYRRLLD